MPRTSLRTAFGRIGGVSSVNGLRTGELPEQQRIYRCAEVVSVNEVFDRHAAQDGDRSQTNSVRRWIGNHCDPDSSETVITDPPDPWTVDYGWKPVKNERSRFLGGFQEYSRVTQTDFPTVHETRDWLWDVRPSPQFTYLLTDDMTGMGQSNPQPPQIHNEWESGSMPLEWRPFWGEYVTFYGRHAYDMGHEPIKTEMHPAHTIVREHTTAAPLGNGGELVPANRAIVGMGFSGGFPGGGASGTDGRWDNEFGGVPSDVWGDTTECWPTNLIQHPLRFQLFPPVPRPSSTASLRRRVILCEVIQADDWNEVDSFLEVCQADDPASGGRDLAFRRWSRSQGLPSGFTPERAPSDIAPQLTSQMNRFYNVEVDLSPLSGIPLGYYAIVECGWNERGPHNIYHHEVTFDRVESVHVDDWLTDDWHLYYGVNGQWGAWWTDDFVEEGETYDIGRSFQVYTVDDMPLLIRDCGIEWEGRDIGNSTLDRVEFDAPGPDPFARLPGSGNPRQFWLDATTTDNNHGDAEHRWSLVVKRRVL